ncbi:hypothetical protein [Formosa sp. A9]|uniref:hypothetical protein n=1 Tax=Formosa sp. A9 TaxID=3442641 RepID=UPI003EBD5B42
MKHLIFLAMVLASLVARAQLPSNNVKDKSGNAGLKQSRNKMQCATDNFLVHLDQLHF